MAKKNHSTPGKPKKSKIGKQQYIDKEIEKAKASHTDSSRGQSPNGTPAKSGTARTRLPLAQLVPPVQSPPVITMLRPKHPKQPLIMSKPPDPESALNQPSPLIWDRRHQDLGLEVLSPRARPAVKLPYAPRGHFNFLDLPGELRNKIYAYALPSELFHIDWVFLSQKTKSLTYRLPRRQITRPPQLTGDVLERRKATRNARIKPTEYHTAIMQDIYRQVTPISLLWVCSTMYPEASSIFYGRSTFRFNRIRTLRHFLDNVSTANKASIQYLSLQYRTYGHTSKTSDRVWKDKADQAWQKLCFRVSDECNHLQKLSLDLNMDRCPLTFGPLEKAIDGCFSTAWMRPLWAFQDIGIKQIYLTIKSVIADKLVLEVACRELREELLGEEWDEEAESKRDAWGFKKRQTLVGLDTVMTFENPPVLSLLH